MNHDETNSKSDPKPDTPTAIDPALEARVVAWVAGEASAFETAELERLIAAQPELAVFKRRIEAVHGLVGEAARPDREPLRMSAERRAKVLQVIGAADGGAASGGVVVTMPMSQARSSWSYWSWRRPQIYFAISGLAVASLILMVTAPWESDRPMRPSPDATVLGPNAGDDRKARIDASAENSALSFKVALPNPEAATSVAASAPRLSINMPVAADASVGEASARGTMFYSAAPQSSSLLQPKVTGNTLTLRTIDMPKGGTGTFTATGVNGDIIDTGLGGSTAVNGQASAGRSNEEARRQLFRETQTPSRLQPLDDTALQRVAPPSPTVAMGGAGGRVAGMEFGQASSVGALATPPADPIIKLDAFTVSADRDVGYAAAAIGGSRSAVANKPITPSPTTFGDSLRADLAKKVSGGGGAASEGRMAENPTNLFGFGQFAVNPGMVLTTSDEKKANLAFVGNVGKETTGVKSGAKSVESDLPLARPAPADKDTNESLRAEVAASAQSESTFSLHVSDVSFRLAQAALARGEMPDADRIRPEEFYNAFNYGDPVPTIAEKVGAKIEQSAHPFLQQRNFVRIAVKVPATGRGATQPLRLTVLLDTSGSMEREDRAATVRRALQELIALLGPNDRITLIGFARQPRLLAEAVAGNQAGWLVDLAAKTPAEGGTNLEAALKLGSDLARRHALAGAQNRIVVLTDGAANLGNADPDQLAKAIEALRQQAIAFDACGIGLDGLDDAVLEALTRRGDGRYYVLNSPDDAGARFAKQLAGAFRPAAENVKLQVRFNAARVGRYRLIGFEQHRLKSEDFRNDRVDAAELAAEEAAVALYQIEVLPEGSGELGEVAVRFRDASNGQMVERSWAIPYERTTPVFDRATKSMQLAGTSALLAEKLRGGAPAGAIRLRDLAPVVNALHGSYANEPRVQEFVAMFAQARRRLGD